MRIQSAVIAVLSAVVLVAPASGSQAQPAHVGIGVSVAAAPTGVGPQVKARPRGYVSGTYRVVAGNRLRVEIASNAKRVTLSWRTAGNKKRSATIRIRTGTGSKTLAKGSHDIVARSRATSKLRKSAKAPIHRGGVLVRPGVPTQPGPSPAPSTAPTPKPSPTNPAVRPSPTATPTPSPPSSGPLLRANGSNDLGSDTALDPGGWLQSPDKRYRFTNQNDGNLVLTVAASGRPVWASGTGGKGAGRLIMQADGNLVLYAKTTGRVLWTTSTSGASPKFTVQSDANLVVYTSAGAKWASSTVNDQLRAGERLQVNQQIRSANGRYRLIQQADANLVVYDGNTPLWAAGTNGAATPVTVMQSDGNLVVYDAAGKPRWASNTTGNPNAWVIMQNDGNLVIYTAGSRALWSIRDNQKGNAAVSWAEARLGQVAYVDYCLKFATDAWQYGAGVPITRYSSARLAWDSQPAKQHRTGAPPRGAMVFWDWSGTVKGVYRNWGHAAIADGNGNVISTAVNGTSSISRRPTSSITLDGYLGWIMPS